MMQSLLPALYPMLKTSYELSFGQIGFLTFTFQVTASLLQPIVGGRAARAGAIGVSGWRQRRVGDGAAACGVHRVAARAVERWVVLGSGAAGDVRAAAGRALVQDARGCATQGEEAFGHFTAGRTAHARSVRDRRAAGADLFEVFLHGESQQLLHAVSHRSLPCVGSAVA